MRIELNDKDVEMINEAFNWCRCLYWDHKLEYNNNYCDGECYNCDKKYTIEKWLQDKVINS